MEITDQDKEVLKMTTEQIWRKGANSPQEGAVANAFTLFVQKVLGPAPKETAK